MTLLTNATIFTPDHTIANGWLLIEAGHIADIGAGNPASANDTIDCDGGYLLPGFIDLHVHGAIGHNVMDASLDALHEMSQYFASHGVTSWLPTTLTASHKETLSALRTVKEAITSSNTTIIGAHLEGPYLNVAKCGAQDAQHIRLANSHELCELLSLDVVKLASIAPEFDDNLLAIKTLADNGVTVSAAHTNATLA